MSKFPSANREPAIGQQNNSGNERWRAQLRLKLPRLAGRVADSGRSSAVFKLEQRTTTAMNVMNRKIDTGSLVLGAFAGAVAVLCVAAAATKGDAAGRCKGGNPGT